MNEPFSVEVELSDKESIPTGRKKLEMALAKGRERQAEMRALGITKKRTMPAASVLLKAIRENCYQCEGAEDPCVRWRIGNCLVPGCTLRPYRPHKELEGTPMPEALKYRDESALDRED